MPLDLSCLVYTHIGYARRGNEIKEDAFSYVRKRNIARAFLMVKDMKTGEGGEGGGETGRDSVRALARGKREERCSTGQEETREAKKHNQNTVVWVSSFVRGCVTSGYLPELRCKAPPRPEPAATPLNAAPLLPPNSCPRRRSRHIAGYNTLVRAM